MECDSYSCIELVKIVYEKKDTNLNHKDIEDKLIKCYEYKKCIEQHVHRLMSQVF